MSRPLHKILLISILVVASAITASAQCPTAASTQIEVCNDAGGNGTLRAYFFNGAEADSYLLFSVNENTYVTVPLGPVTVNTSIARPPGAVAGVEFGLIPDGEYIIRVNCQGGNSVVIGGAGIAVSSGSALTAGITVDPDCNPASGGGTALGEISLNISGGVAPYDITWPTTVTPIADDNNVAAGVHDFPGLDGGMYTVEIRDANNCLFTADIDVRVATQPAAGGDQTVCGFSATLGANSPAPGETGTWTGPPGVTFSPDANAPNAVASNLSVGVNILTWTISDNTATCPALDDQVQITSDDPATAIAGPPQTICSGTSVTLSGSIGGTATSSSWSTSGDGTFDDATSLTAIYSPGPGDITLETVTLTLTTDDPNGPCVSVSDDVIITIDEGATVDAGTAQTICSTGTATLDGSFSGAASSANWTTAGDGSFDDVTSPTAIYTPGPNDILAETVTLTFTTDDPNGPCLADDDIVVITIDAGATADAGTPQTICSGTTVTLSGSIGGAATSATWTTSGDGTFDDATSLTAIYTPGPGDITLETVTLTLTTDDPMGPCVAVSSAVIITIDEGATVDAGTAQTICSTGTATLSGSFSGAASSATWTTAGDGSFDDVTSPTAIYTPGPNDILAETVTLTFTSNDPAGPCLPDDDIVVITIDAVATADAGTPQTICSGTSVTLSGSIGGAATSATWTTSGDGTFDDATSLTAIYTPGPGDITLETVTLTLATDDPNGPCVSVSDDVIITIDEGATVDAGTAQTICSTGTATLSGSFGGAASNATWTTAGDGSFDDVTSPTAIYTPGPNDILAETVTLTFTTDDPNGPCLADDDIVVITIDAGATADAGTPQTICSGTTVTLSGSIGGAATSATWTTSGDGTFDDATSLTAIYTPGPGDITLETVTLTLTTDDPMGPCVAVSSAVIITIDEGATVDAGTAQTICSTGTATLSGSFSGAASSATWTTAGDGGFDDVTSPTAIYTPGPNDILAETVTLTFTSNDPAGPCLPDDDIVVITIDAVATADAGTPQTICSGTSVTLSGSIGGTASSATWTTSGDGTFDDATSLTAIYTPGPGDITLETVTLTLTTDDPNGPCVSVSDDVIITIDEGATVDAGTAQTICSAGTATLSGSFGGAASGATWTTAGDGGFDDVTSPTAIYTPGPNDVLAGTVTLTFTTDDPAGPCLSAAGDVVITITASASADAGIDQTICVGGTAILAGTFSATTGITWSTSGDGAFDDVTLPNAVYTPGPTDVGNTTVTLTLTTAGPCAPVTDDVVITIDPAPVVDAGVPQTICSTGFIVLNGSFGGSATGLLWSTSGNGSFDDTTDPNATYTPGSDDMTNGTVTLTATATGSCAGTFDDVMITVDPAATVSAGSDQTVCFGSDVLLAGSFGGATITVGWTTSGDGTFNDNTDPSAVYTPGANDLINGTVSLTLTTNNPPGPCPAANDDVVIALIPTPGDQTTAGNETWIGYVYDDTGDPTPIPGKIDFDNAKYKGYITEADIPAMSAGSSYDTGTDAFDLNLNIITPLQGTNVCGTYVNHYSVRYKMDKTFPAGVYRFTVGGDDGVRLLIDGVNVLPPEAFDFQSYTTYTTDPICLSAGVHNLEIHYFDNTAQSRLSFDYEEVPAVTTNSPLAVCINTPPPALSVSSADADVIDFNWYRNGVLVFTGADYTPAAAELDMTAEATVTFEVTAIYACGETQPVDVVVDVLNAATLVTDPQTICESAGVVDLRTLMQGSPTGGTFTFSGHPNISGFDFDPAGLSGSTISIQVDYSTGSCTAPQGTLDLTITNTATVNVPASPVDVCELSADIDLTTLVSASPAGGTFTFTGTQVFGNLFDPSGLSGIQSVTVDYTLGGCFAPPATLELNVTSTASISPSNTTVCESGSPVNLTSLISASPAGGTFTFTGVGVSGNLFDPAGQSGVINIDVDYDFNGCTDSGILSVTVVGATDPMCTGGNCASVVIVPLPEPATCTNSDGRLVMSITPFTPTVNNTGVKITIDGISSTNIPISRTIFNDNVFEALPVGQYNYTIEYGDPSCIKTGMFSIDQSGTVGTPVVSNVVSPVCPGSATGSLTLDVPGETGNVLEWSLDAGLTDPFKPFTAGTQISGLPAAPAPTFQHVISVRRNVADVCYSSVTVTMPESVPPVTASFTITPATCNGNDGAITNIVASGGNDAPFTYSIDGGLTFQGTPEFNGLSGGSYALSVRDAAGCVTDFTADVTFPGFINSVISKNNADCSNGGDSGSISVVVNDAGIFEVALSTDQFNEPSESDYQAYSNPSINFNGLSRGEYYVYVRSASGSCPTRSAPINIFGVYDITFDLQPDCNNNEVSLALLNVTGDVNGAPLEIQVSKALSSDPPEIIYQQFPADGEVYLDHDQYSFLQTPGEYRLKIIQFQNEVICNFSSEVVNFTIPEPLVAQISLVEESYPDIPTGRMHVSGVSGGVFPFDVRIELDSAASFSQPYYVTDFEEADLNENAQVEMAYNDIPAGRYQVEVRDAQGCVLGLIGRVPLDVDLFIPNIFTPNGDGSNDVFFIRNLPQEPAENRLTISNRWGKQVFVSENYQNNWDAEGIADGIYFYKLEVADESLTGWVEILRGQKP